MLSKKNLLFILCFLFAAVPLFCQKVNFFTFEKPEITANFSITENFVPELCTDTVITDNYISFDFTELYFDCGTAFQSDRFDYTSHINYMPVFRQKYSAGLGFFHHLMRYYDTFTENDLGITTRFYWNPNAMFNLELAPGFMFKLSSIDSLKSTKPVIFNCGFILAALVRLNLTQDFGLYFSISSLDFFDVPLFGTPFLKTGFSYRFTDDFGFDFSVTCKFFDMVVSAVMLNQCAVKATVKVYF